MTAVGIGAGEHLAPGLELLRAIPGSEVAARVVDQELVFGRHTGVREIEALHLWGHWSAYALPLHEESRGFVGRSPREAIERVIAHVREGVEG